VAEYPRSQRFIERNPRGAGSLRGYEPPDPRLAVKVTVIDVVVAASPTRDVSKAGLQLAVSVILLLEDEKRSFSGPMPACRCRLSIEQVKLFEKIQPRQLALDGLIAAGTLTLALVSRFQIEADIAAVFSRESDALQLLLIALMTVPLVLRRVYPTAVFFLILAAWAAERSLDYPETLAVFSVVIAFYTIGAELSRRSSLRIGGITALFILAGAGIGVVTLESVRGVGLITTMIITVTPLLLGREVHEQRRRVEELRERAERAERDREEKARRAVADERTRIARELHDVVAHQMTVMTLQAEGARRIADGADPRVTDALETISDAGHKALREMRRTVGLLRAPEDETETQPLPRLRDVEELVDTIRAAGVAVNLEIEGDVRPLAEGTELSAYRIVQESLTNSVRHGGPDVTAQVKIEYGEDHLEVLVLDDGRGASVDTGDGVGHGIIGMRERIAVLDGDFEAGPHTGGGYEVRASIPVES
jgi:signal transduction histidine kinase